MLYAIVTDAPPLLTSVNPALPSELEKIITKALKKEPNERYASVQTMVEDLENIKTQFVQTKDLAVGRIEASQVTHGEDVLGSHA